MSGETAGAQPERQQGERERYAVSGGWLLEHGITCVTCPDCAFKFAAEHSDEGGGYSCPLCTPSVQQPALQCDARQIGFRCVLMAGHSGPHYNGGDMEWDVAVPRQATSNAPTLQSHVPQQPDASLRAQKPPLQEIDAAWNASWCSRLSDAPDGPISQAWDVFRDAFRAGWSAALSVPQETVQPDAQELGATLWAAYYQMLACERYCARSAAMTHVRHVLGEPAAAQTESTQEGSDG